MSKNSLKSEHQTEIIITQRQSIKYTMVSQQKVPIIYQINSLKEFHFNNLLKCNSTIKLNGLSLAQVNNYFFNMSRLFIERLFNQACNKIDLKDIANKGFLKPIEIALKTYQTQKQDIHSLHQFHLSPSSLPVGLKIAVRQSLGSNRLQLHHVDALRQHDIYSDIKQKHMDNLLSLIKKRGKKEGIKLAICVCMYSEDWLMLKGTLAGIADNIAHMVAYQKVDPDQIGVFVMMDGIEKVDDSIANYVGELQRETNLHLGKGFLSNISEKQMHGKASIMDFEQILKEELSDVNNFMLTAEELQERSQTSFKSIIEDYKQMKQFHDLIVQLEIRPPKYDSLPLRLQKFFIKEARNQRRVDYGETEEQANEIGIDRIVQEYGYNSDSTKILIYKALQNAKRECEDYLSSRDDLAFLTSFRKQVNFPQSILDKIGNPKQKQKQVRRKKYKRELKENNLSQSLQQVQYQQQRLQPQRKKTVMNLFFCVKYKNAGKLSSHNWFFNGFCKELNAKYAILLDVGLKPEKTALLKMYTYMCKKQNIGGVCGYMGLKIQPLNSSDQLNEDEADWLTQLVSKFVDIQRTQQVQYHFAHLMDKPYEAIFKFIHVLPGAFSGYNLQAILKRDIGDECLMQNYFKSIRQKLQNRRVMQTKIGLRDTIIGVLLPDILNRHCIHIDPDSDEGMLYNQNVFLAEDRILCMGIHKKGLDMAYLPDACAEVDPMKTIQGMMGQRKRWINGTYFGFQKVKAELTEHQKRSQKCSITLNIQLFYITFMNWLSYFSPAMLLFSLHITVQILKEVVISQSGQTTIEYDRLFANIVIIVFTMIILYLIYHSLFFGHNESKFKQKVYLITSILGIFTVAIFVLFGVEIVRSFINTESFQNVVGYVRLVLKRECIQKNGSERDLCLQGIEGQLDKIRGLLTATKWMLVGTAGFYIIPTLLYCILYRKIHIIFQIMAGSLSFIFYTPFYLLVLNIYSLCRMDDISWGTKGIDNSNPKHQNLKGSWKLIKFVHVFKFLFWNLIIGFVMINLGENPLPQLYLTFVVISIISFLLGLKGFFGVIYIIKYRIQQCTMPQNDNPSVDVPSSVDMAIKRYKPEIMKEVKDNLQTIRKYLFREKSMFKSSFLLANNTRSSIQQKLHKFRNIMKVPEQLQMSPVVPIAEISEPREQDISSKPVLVDTNKNELFSEGSEISEIGFGSAKNFINRQSGYQFTLTPKQVSFEQKKKSRKQKE